MLPIALPAYPHFYRLPIHSVVPPPAAVPAPSDGLFHRVHGAPRKACLPDCTAHRAVPAGHPPFGFHLAPETPLNFCCGCPVAACLLSAPCDALSPWRIPARSSCLGCPARCVVADTRAIAVAAQCGHARRRPRAQRPSPKRGVGALEHLAGGAPVASMSMPGRRPVPARNYADDQRPLAEESAEGQSRSAPLRWRVLRANLAAAGGDLEEIDSPPRCQRQRLRSPPPPRPIRQPQRQPPAQPCGAASRDRKNRAATWVAVVGKGTLPPPTGRQCSGAGKRSDGGCRAATVPRWRSGERGRAAVRGGGRSAAAAPPAIAQTGAGFHDARPHFGPRCGPHRAANRSHSVANVSRGDSFAGSRR